MRKRAHRVQRIRRTRFGLSFGGEMAGVFLHRSDSRQVGGALVEPAIRATSTALLPGIVRVTFLPGEAEPPLL